MANVSITAPVRPESVVIAQDAAWREWRNGWPVVVAGFFGFMTLTLGTATIGAFMAPIEAEFNWTRANFTSGLAVIPLASMLFALPAGALIDKFGPRPIALIGAVFGGLAYSLFAMANELVRYWIALWLFYSIVHQLVLPALWSTAIARSFNESRGLAMSVIMLGSAVTFAVGPIIANLLIENYGWRIAFIGIGAGSGFLLFFASLFGLPGGRPNSTSAAATRTTAGPSTVTGYGFLAGLRSAAFIKLAVTVLVVYTASMAVIIHIIPILEAASLSRDAAVMTGGSLGLSMIAGKLIIGFSLDRFPGHWVAAVVVALVAACVALLAIPVQSLASALCAAVLFGVTYGAAAPLFPYLASRYLGMRSFAKLFSILMCLAGAGTALGPFLAGLLFDITRGYLLFLAACIPALLIVAGLFASMGSFPKFDEEAQS